MQKRGDSAALARKSVVLFDRFTSLLLYDVDPAFCEDPEGVGTRIESKVASPAQDDDVGLVLEELVDVRWLNARTMFGLGLFPIPSSSATRPKLGVTKTSETFDIEVAPAVGTDLGRALGLHEHTPTLKLRRGAVLADDGDTLRPLS